MEPDTVENSAPNPEEQPEQPENQGSENAAPSEPPESGVPPAEPSSAPPPITEAPAPSIEAPYGYRADGSPAKKRGRKPAGERLDSVTPAPPRAKAPSPPPAAPPPISPVAAIAPNYEAMGQTAATLWFGCGTMVFGADWQPDTAAGEHLQVKDAFKNYFVATNATQLSPEVVLAVTLLSYTVVRIQKPTVKERATGMWLWIKNKIPKRAR